MSYSPETRAEYPEFIKRKAAQWARITEAIPGLQAARTGDQFMLTYSPHDESTYESVIFGQLPQVVQEAYGSRLNPMYRDVANDKKSFEDKRIDLSDAELDQVVAQWKAGKSALELPFVEAVIVHGKVFPKFNRLLVQPKGEAV